MRTWVCYHAPVMLVRMPSLSKATQLVWSLWGLLKEQGNEDTQPCVAGCGDIGDSAAQIPQRGNRSEQQTPRKGGEVAHRPCYQPRLTGL